MRYTLKQLNYIEVAARHKSISRASQELNISPSSISSAIDAVEQDTKRALFDRLPSKGISPTQFGLTFLSHARQFLKAHRNFEDSINEQSSIIGGAIRMGCFTPAAPIILPLVIQEIAQAHPDILIQFSEGDSLDIYRDLLESNIDLAFGFQADPTVANLTFRHLFTASPHIVLPKDHPLAKETVLSLQDVHELPMILLDLKLTRDYMFGLFTKEGLTPKISYSSKSSEMVRSMVAAGLGYSIFHLRPLKKQQYTVGDLVRIPTTPSYQSVEFGILHREDASLSKVDQVMIETCQHLQKTGAFDKVTLPHRSNR